MHEPRETVKVIEGWLNFYVIGINGTTIKAGEPDVFFATEEAAWQSLRDLGPVYFDVSASVTEAKFWIKDSVYTDNVGGIDLVLTKVPIPGAIWLLGSGLFGLVAIRRKFRT